MHSGLYSVQLTSRALWTDPKDTSVSAYSFCKWGREAGSS